MRNIFLFFLLLSSSTLFSQSLFENAATDNKDENKELKIDFSGYARGSAFLGFEDYDFTTIFGEVGLISKLNYKKTFLFADVRIREGYAFNESFSELQLKEAYAGFSGKSYDVLLGNQIINWGRSDGFNPTNCITPTHFFFLTGDPDDQKLPNFLLRFKYRITDQIEIDLISIPIYRPSIYRYELFEFGGNVAFSEILLPDKTYENGSLAARLNFEYSKVGFSVSWFRGYSPDYGFNVGNIDYSTGLPIITNAPVPYMKNMFGADIALPASAWVFRGELAYNFTDDYAENMFVPNPDINYVVGIERSIFGFNTILQYIGKYTFDFAELEEPALTDLTDPTMQLQYINDLIHYESESFNRKRFYQQKESNHAFALTINKPFAYDTWNFEMTGYYNLTSEEYILRPKLSWNVTDALSTSVGCAYMVGPEKQIFDYAAPVLNGAFLELKANF